MIKLNNINKYFNHRRKNEIHVVKNVSLELPNTGLVCLLGPSGSGKTTLLNILSGLDKANSGTVDLDGKILKRFKERTWNYYRNVQFGYIFQNYLLIQDMTVYENLEFVLKPFNLNKDEIEDRVEYALKSVGMERYKKRKPSQLSGGQQQRVAIARALVKSPDVYIADEPTGNTDEKNTTQIMNILKKISKNSLVILVTHEKRLATFYSDRIVELKDGEIVADYINTHTDVFSKYDDRNIYLQEYDKVSKSLNDIDVNYFSKDKDDSPIELNIIYDDDTYYISSPTKLSKVKFIDPNDEIKVIDSKRPIIHKADIEDFEYDLPKITKDKKKHRSVFKLKDTIQIAINEVKSMKPIQKIMFIIFFITAILFTYGIAAYNESTYLDERIFLNYNRDLIEFNSEVITTIEDLDNLEELVNDNLILPHRKNTYIQTLRIEEFDQRKTTISLTRKSAVPLDVLGSPNLVVGKIPETPFEMAIDIYLLNQLLETEEIKSTGIKTKEQFIGVRYVAKNAVYEIVGVLDNNNPNFYVSLEAYKLMALNGIFLTFDQPFADVYIIYDDIGINPDEATNILIFEPIVEDPEIEDPEIKDPEKEEEEKEEIDSLDKMELGENEILVSTALFTLITSYQKDYFHVDINGKVYKIIGTYDYKNLYDKSFYIQKDQLDDLYDFALLFQDNLYVIGTDKANLMNALDGENFNSIDLYKLDFDSFIILERDSDLILYSTLMIILNLVFLFFIMRSSSSSRINKIGIFRSLGVSRMNIIRIFIFEILIITLISSFTGIALISFAIVRLNTFVDFIYYPLFIPFLSFAIILMINMVVGIIPIVTTLRQTPSQILSRYDL